MRTTSPDLVFSVIPIPQPFFHCRGRPDAGGMWWEVSPLAVDHGTLVCSVTKKPIDLCGFNFVGFCGTFTFRVLFYGFTICIVSTFVFTICHLSFHACVIFVSIAFDLCRWQVHSPRDPRRQKTVGRPAARQVVFCFYVRCRLQLHSAGVQAMFVINVLVPTSKSHMRGMCNRLLVHLCQWKRHRGVESDPEKDGAQTQWSAQGIWLA